MRLVIFSILEKNIFGNKIDLNHVAFVEPDEFNLDISSRQDNSSNTNASNIHASFINNTYPDYTNNQAYQQNQTQKFATKQNKSLEMSTYNGNPYGVVKFTNSKPANSVRPINSLTRTNNDLSTQFDNMSFSDNMTQMTHTTNMSYAPSQNSIVKQTSFMQNPLAVQSNGGKRRSSNLDVGSSNNYVIINN